MALSDTGLVARWWFEEAASGTTPATVPDASGVGVASDLTINYGSGNLAWTEVSGNRGLVSSATTGTQRCEKDMASGEKLFDSLTGVTKATLVMVVDVDAFAAGGGRIAGINDTGGNNGRLMVRGTATNTWQFSFNDTIRRTWDGPETRHVLHVVVDTTQATANDRVKIYQDGSILSPTVNSNPGQNDTLSLAGTVEFICFNRVSSGNYDRSITGTIFYVAAHNDALTAVEVASDYDDLIVDDDDPVVGGGGGLSIPVAMHSYRRRRAA